MALHLSGIFGTEKDKVNCPFYFKIGACRHGEKCSRIHHKPAYSQTILLAHMYQHPLETDDKKRQEHFEDFYEDVFGELEKYGQIEELNVCDNLAEHLIGNVYVKYRFEEDASKAVKSLTGRFYSGRLLIAELSPVTDFREACCRQFETGECSRGGHCNFLHLKEVSRELRRKLFRPRHHRSRSPVATTTTTTTSSSSSSSTSAPSATSTSASTKSATHHHHHRSHHSRSRSPSSRSNRRERRERSKSPRERSRSAERKRERSHSPTGVLGTTNTASGGATTTASITSSGGITTATPSSAATLNEKKTDEPVAKRARTEEKEAINGNVTMTQHGITSSSTKK